MCWQMEWAVLMSWVPVQGPATCDPLMDFPTILLSDLAGLQAINLLGKKARDGTLSIDEMAGGTFTISNGGVFGRSPRMGAAVCCRVAAERSVPLLRAARAAISPRCVDMTLPCPFLSGSVLSTPIINPPQSAILGMHATNMRPYVVGGQIVPRWVHAASMASRQWQRRSSTALRSGIPHDHLSRPLIPTTGPS